jgi:hypothetical protein
MMMMMMKGEMRSGRRGSMGDWEKLWETCPWQMISYVLFELIYEEGMLGNKMQM